MKTIEDFREIVGRIEYPGYMLGVFEDKDGLYLMGIYNEPDVVTGKLSVQKTRKWKLSPHMTLSEVTQTAFKCLLTSAEHRVREHFLYRGHRVYSPHYDVEALVELCENKRFDERTDWYGEDGQ